VHQYLCPSCGSDGPHPIIFDDDVILVLECAVCYADIDIPWENVTAIDQRIQTRQEVAP